MIALGEPPAAAVREQPVVCIGGLRPAKQRLQQAMNRGCRQQVLGACYQGDALGSVIMRDCKMIARGHVLAAQHDVTEYAGVTRDPPILFAETERADTLNRRSYVEPECIGPTCGNAAFSLGRWQMPADAWIERRSVRCMWSSTGSGDLAQDLRARAETGIDEALFFESHEQRTVLSEMLRLHPHLAVPIKTEPSQVFEDGGVVFGSAAIAVDVFDPEQEVAASGARVAPGNECGMCMTEMKKSGRARCEAGNGGHDSVRPTILGPARVPRALALGIMMARLFTRLFTRSGKGEEAEAVPPAVQAPAAPQAPAPEVRREPLLPRVENVAPRKPAAPAAAPSPPPAPPAASSVPNSAAPTRPAKAPAAHKELSAKRWGPKSGGAPEYIIFMCHGLGSSAGGIIQLAAQLDGALNTALFVAPNGPEPSEAGPDARQWFNAQNRMPKALEAGVRAAAAALNPFIDAELDRAGLAPDAYALAGYSQGAMTALFCGLRRNPGPRAILCYAAALIAPEKLADELACRPPVMLGHGLADPVVPAFYSRDAEKALRALKIPVHGLYVPRLGHNIDAPALQAGKQFLRRWLVVEQNKRAARSLADG